MSKIKSSNCKNNKNVYKTTLFSGKLTNIQHTLVTSYFEIMINHIIIINKIYLLKNFLQTFAFNFVQHVTRIY